MTGNNDNEDDSDLFRSELGDVRPIGPMRKRRHRRPLPSTRPRQKEADEAQAVIALHDGSLDRQIDTGEEMRFRRPGVQHSVMRKLSGGRYRIDAELDLHGQTVNAARFALAGFLMECLDQGYRCVRIIHGKGIRSGPEGPRLRPRVAHWLAQRDEVLAYATALPRHGGTGAVYVLLRRQ